MWTCIFFHYTYKCSLTLRKNDNSNYYDLVNYHTFFYKILLLNYKKNYTHVNNYQWNLDLFALSCQVEFF